MAIYKREPFRSIEELVQQALQPENGSGGRDSRNHPSSFDWDDYVGFSGAVQLVRTGWPEGAQKAKAVLDLVANILKPKTHEVRPVYQDSGGAYIDVARFVSSEPECFGVFIPPENPQKPLKVLVNCAIAASVSAEEYIRRGAAIVAAIDILETRGYIVECDVVDVTCSSSTRYQQDIVLIRVKEMGQPVDLDRLAFCLAHPAFLRRLIFAIHETSPQVVRNSFGYKHYGTYGTPGDWSSDETDLYFSYLTRRTNLFRTPESCAEWVRGKLARAGLVREDEYVG